VRRGPGTAFLAAALAVGLTTSASGDAGYEAKFIGQSDYLTLESGQRATSWFDAQNVGSATWTNDVVRLGTTNPRDRGSVFANTTWINAGRPTPLDQAFVEPGRVGRFTFTVAAPNVTATAVFDEYFAPLAEGRAWMENDVANWPPNGVFLRYTVVPAAPPKVAITSQPSNVAQGTPVVVRASASDNVSVNRVEFSIAGGRVIADRSAPYEATLDTTGVRSGPQTVTVRAVDQTGRSASATGTVTLDPFPNGAGAARDAKMTAGFGKRRPRPRVTVPYGTSTYVRGKLTDGAGRPITGAVIRVFTRVLSDDRGFRELPPVSTGQDGGYAYRAPRGPSRQILLTYTPFADDAQPAVQKLVRMATRAGIAMRASRRSARPGGRVKFKGRLKGGRIPRRGVLVSLQGHQRGFGWRTFRTVRAKHGRFKGSYRFVAAAPGSAVRFRATVRQQTGYPWAAGRSRPATVRIR
jgi:Big-like domain-containing protein